MLKFPIDLEQVNHYSQSFLVSNYKTRITARLWEPIMRGGGQKWTVTFNCLSIIYLFSGDVTIIDEKEQIHRLNPGDLVFRHPHRRHAIIRETMESEKGIEFFLRIPSEIYENMVGLGIINPDEFIINIGTDQLLVDKFISFIDKLGMYSLKELPLFNIELMNFIYELKQRKEKFGMEEYNIDKIKQSCVYLSENFNKKITIPDCAKKFGMGYQSFRKTFAKIIGIPPQEYRVRKRIEAASEMIEYSDLSLKEISVKLGYSGFANFALQFKKFTGQPPGSIRKRYKMKNNY